MFLTEPSSVAMNATNSSQDYVGGEVGLLLRHLIYINNNSVSFFSWCFFCFLLNLKYLSRSWAIYTTPCSQEELWRGKIVSCASPCLCCEGPGHMLSSPLLLLGGHPPSTFGPLAAVPHINYNHHRNGLQNVCAEALPVQIRGKTAAFSKPTSLIESDLFFLS